LTAERASGRQHCPQARIERTPGADCRSDERQMQRLLEGWAPADEIEELAERIDAEREGAALMRRCAQLPAVECPVSAIRSAESRETTCSLGAVPASRSGNALALTVSG
jgi:hypothetical protein